MASFPRKRADGDTGALTRRARLARLLRRRLVRLANRLVRYPYWAMLADWRSRSGPLVLRRRLAALDRQPRFAVLLVPDRQGPQAAAALLTALSGQPYRAWRLIIGYPAAGPPPDLPPAGAVDVLPMDRSGSAGPLLAAAVRDSDFVILADGRSQPARSALGRLALALAAQPDSDVLYGDEDECDGQGRRCAGRFQPPWDADRFLGQHYLGGLVAVRSTLVAALGELPPAPAGAAHYDLLLRLTAGAGPDRIRHVPAVLCHRAAGSGWDPVEPAAARQAVAGHLQRQGVAASVVAPAPGAPGRRLVWPLPEPPPAITLIVPTRDRLDLLCPCIDGLLHRTDYPGLRLMIVDNDSQEPATRRFLGDLATDPRVTVLPAPGPFNFAALNNGAAAAADTPLIGFINNDIDVIHGDWLREMASQALRPAVGAVGAKLLYGDGTIQHAGVIIGPDLIALHADLHRPGDAPGYGQRLRLVHAVAAVTGACLVMRRSLFHQAGGFDATAFPVAFNDIDLCLHLRAAGYRILWTPYACLYHRESASRGSDRQSRRRAGFQAELAALRRRWLGRLPADPAYPVQLNRCEPDFGLAFPPLRD